jgi:pteridine reductase
MPVKPEKEKGVALITGAARRVGRAIALRLSDEGYDIAFTYLNSAVGANELSEEVRKKGRSALAIQADLTDPDAAVETIFAQVSKSFGRLDALVNNASLYEPDASGAAAMEQMRRFWAIHVGSPLLLSKAFFPMLEKAGGCIINMVDLQAERPIAGYLSYCASKAGLWNLTLGMARQFAPWVRVNGIAPGVIEWPPDLPQEDRDKYLRRVPLARAGTPADAADVAAFLVGGSSYMTGQILRVDGGRSIA